MAAPKCSVEFHKTRNHSEHSLKDAPTEHHTFRHRSDREKRTYFLTPKVRVWAFLIHRQNVCATVITLNIRELRRNRNTDLSDSLKWPILFSWRREKRVGFRDQGDVISNNTNSIQQQHNSSRGRRRRRVGVRRGKLCPGDNRGLWPRSTGSSAGAGRQTGRRDQSTPGTRGPSTARSQASQRLLTQLSDSEVSRLQWPLLSVAPNLEPRACSSFNSIR